jgi:hypothetical protein
MSSKIPERIGEAQIEISVENWPEIGQSKAQRDCEIASGRLTTVCKKGDRFLRTSGCLLTT